ncbi:hypothetical protein N7495_000546 [Penicillium taxi]|uniref:uncharacterized protein n=1 Tax=Penicillium taxi TaxID=168475 RepID=UPI0025454E4C|nr:uncharacterized protein N7495_000546 [Penicillium taxi]KAJ5907864.1 hypothetical protein N7495_000546 [Penicillium taxi]
MSLSQSAMMVLEGELQSALANKDLLPVETYELELKLATNPALRWRREGDDSSDCSIAAGEKASFTVDVLGKPGLQETTVQIDYSRLNAAPGELPDVFYTRQLFVPLTVTKNNIEPPVESVKESDALLSTEENDPFSQVLSRLGNGAYGPDHCVVLVDLRNAWPNPVSVWLRVSEQSIEPSSTEVTTSSDTTGQYSVGGELQPGQTSRFVLVLPRVYLDNPHASIPVLSFEAEAASREAFWFREELLKRVLGGWKESATSREGSIDLRNIRLNNRMVEAMRLEDVEMTFSLTSPSSPDDSEAVEQTGRSRFCVKTDDLLTLTVTVHNRSSRPIHPLLRLQPSIRHQPNNVALDLTRRLVWTGMLQQALPILPSGESAKTSIGLTVLCRGEYEFGASVEEARILRPSVSDGNAPSADAADLHDEGGIKDTFGVDVHTPNICTISHDKARHMQFDEYNVLISPKKLNGRFFLGPDHVSLANAVATFRAYATAYYALVNLAHLQCSETILIHGADGEQGKAAIHLSRYFGAKVFATVGSEEQREIIAKEYSLPQDRVFNSNSGSFAHSVLRATNGEGVDVVLSLVDDDSAPQERLCVGDFGRFVGLAGRDHSSYSGLSTMQQRNVVFATLDMEVVEKSRPPTGKFILDLADESPVPVILPRLASLELDSEATYILSGGLGGLGPSVAEMMVSHGARHLVFLSRSGPKSAEAQEHLRRLSGLGCKAEAFACDIGTLSSVELVQQLGTEKGWKIRGVVQCAMVLRDSTFENMTHQKWTESIQPKIYGSWNLHQVFGSQSLDFFIMLSSVSGVIGNPAQGNYTAGNTYQDGLALYRRQQGLPGTALAVGAVMDVGAFADNSYFENFLEKFEHLASLTVKIEEVMIILQTLMKGQTEDGVTVPPLLAMGFTEELKRDGNITSLWPKDRKFDHRIELPEDGDANAGGDKVRLADLIGQVTDLAEAGKVVEEALKANLANAMTASPEDVDADKPLHAYGVDSLKAVEVRNWLFRELKCDISVFDILSPMSLAKLSVNIAEKSKFLPESIKRGDQFE